MSATQESTSSRLIISTGLWSALEIPLLILLEGSVLLPVRTLPIMRNMRMGLIDGWCWWHKVHSVCGSGALLQQWVQSGPTDWTLLQLGHSSGTLMAHLPVQGNQEGSRSCFLSLLKNDLTHRKYNKVGLLLQKLVVNQISDSQMDIYTWLCDTWSTQRHKTEKCWRLMNANNLIQFH